MASSDYETSEDFTLDLVDEVPCPKCDDSLRVPKDYSGKIMCPNCEWKFQFPLPSDVDMPAEIPDWLDWFNRYYAEIKILMSIMGTLIFLFLWFFTPFFRWFP